MHNEFRMTGLQSPLSLGESSRVSSNVQCESEGLTRNALEPIDKHKSMGDFLQARIDQGDIWEAGGRLRCRRRLGMHVYHLCLQLLLLAQVCRLRSLVKLRIGDESQTVLDTTCDRGLLAKTKEGQANAAL